MVGNGITLPKLTDKQLTSKTSKDTRSKNNVFEGKLENSRSEIKSLCPPLSKTSGIMDIERRTLGPLVEWQIHRATQDFPDVSLRQQEAMVTEWLHKNHFRVTNRLPRLDPLILTTRGADFSKFINFIYPAPFSLKFNSTSRRRRKHSYEEEIAKLKEPCPRLQRGKRNNTDEFNLNPVIRVGGGYKRLTWNTWEVLPAIGQSSEDLTSAFTCTRCGVNLAVPHEITDKIGQNKLIITYPSNCANCGKEVNSPRLQIQAGNIGQQPVTQEELENRQGYYKARPHRQDTDSCHETSYTSGEHLRTRSEDDHSALSDDTGLSFTPGGRENSFFITEADGSIKLIKRSQSYQDVNDPSSNTSRPRDEMQIIEHRDPESGIKVRVRRKGGRKGNEDEPYDVSDQEDRDNGGKFGMESKKRGRSRKGLVISQGDIVSDESEDSEGFHSFFSQQNKEQQSFRKKKSSSRLSRYLGRRHAMSDSELLIPDRYWNFLKRLKRVSSKKGNKRSSRYQSYSNECKEGTGSSEDWKRTGTGLVAGKRTASSSALVEMRNRSMHQEPDNPDGYMADSEEDSLLKLQAQLLQLKLDARKKSSGKDKKTRSRAENSKSRTRSRSSHVKEKSGQLSKKTSSLSIFGLDSDSWDSDESLHFDPFSDEYYSSDSEVSPLSRRQRAVSLDERELPSHGNRLIKIYDELTRGCLRALKDSAENDDGMVNGRENNEADVHGPGGEKRKYRHSFKRKTTNKTRKAVPTLPFDSHRSKPSSKWDDDDLSESDINLLTAQMQKSFKPKENPDSAKPDDRHCEGQYCYRCGNFINECEATCTACGTHCKRPDAPCKVCRETIESGVEGLGTSEEEELKAEGIGLKGEKNKDVEKIKGLKTEKNKELDKIKGLKGEKNKDVDKMKGSQNEVENDVNDERKGSQNEVENDVNDERKDYGDVTFATEDSFGTERSSTGQRSSKRGRKIIVKKHRKSGSRYTKRGNRQRSSTMDTMDSMETVLDDQPFDSEEGEICDEENDLDSKDIEGDEFHVAKPQLSKYNKSNKKSKPSKMVVSQRVMYKNGSSLSQGSSMDQAHEGDAEDERDGNEEEDENKIDDEEGDKKDETQVPEELPPQEDHKDETPQQKLITEEFKQVESKKEETEKPKEEDKPKPKIPKPKLRGVQRVNAAYKERVELNRRLQSMLKDALQNVIAEADIKVRRDSTIDYLAQYRLVDRSKIEVYGRAFALEDEEERGIINFEQMLLALEGIPTILGMSRQQLNYVLQVLEINSFSRVSFKMFAVITALCEKVTTLDAFVKELVEGLDLTQTEWKLDLYKDMFYVAGNRSASFISPNDLRIELKAGGLSQKQEDHVIRHITQSSDNGQISFLDYMAYLPLFLSIHQNICSNALDMSRDKYTSRKAKTTV